MISLEDRLAAIAEKVERLLEENQRLRAEHSEAVNRAAEMTQTLEVQKNAIAELTERNKMIKLAKNLSLSGSDSFDIKIKINEMVREIDRCIDLLNE